MRISFVHGMLAASVCVAASSAQAQFTAEAPRSTAHAYQYTAGLNYTSIWDVENSRAVPTGESFSSAVLGQNSASAFFLDDVPDSFTFGGPAQDAGPHVVTGAATRVSSFQVGNDVVVSAFTLDSSDWLPVAFDPGNGDLINVLRMDTGGFAAGPDPITYPGYSPAHVLSVEMVLFIDGGAVFSTGPLSAGNLDLTSGLASVGLVSGAVGAGIDEIQFVYHLSVPAPGTAGVLAIAGFAAVRRRR